VKADGDHLHGLAEGVARDLPVELEAIFQKRGISISGSARDRELRFFVSELSPS
jgi:hypothetical protein